MTLFISIINHGHDDMIVANPTLVSLAKEFKVIIKSNTPASNSLSNYCTEHGITLIQGKTTKGFGANNNEVFRYVVHNHQPIEQDYFLVLNPDVEIETKSLNDLIQKAKSKNSDISAINLFTDREFSCYDNSIRQYPKLLSPLKSLLRIKRNDVYDKNQINHPIKIEWAAGSFLLFKIDCYEKLGGFDEKYFMYFEDADIFRRANKKHFNTFYFPDIKAIHYASHQNRRVFSKHFYWYCKSSFLFHVTKYLTFRD